MRSGMRIHAQERFPEAVFFDRVRRRQTGLLRPRVNRHRFSDGLCQVNHLHIIFPFGHMLSLCLVYIMRTCFSIEIHSRVL